MDIEDFESELLTSGNKKFIRTHYLLLVIIGRHGYLQIYVFKKENLSGE